MKPNKLLICLLLSTALAGCGQPGPLYLPGHTAPIYVAPEPTPQPTPKPEKAK